MKESGAYRADLALLFAVIIVSAFAILTPGTVTMALRFSLGILLLLIAGKRFWTAGVLEASNHDRIWYRLAIWLFIWSLAGSFRFLEALLEQSSYGVISDCFWIAGYLPLISGIYAWCNALQYPIRIRNVLIAAPVAAGLVLLFLEPLIRDPTRSTLFKALDVIYPTMDLAAITLLAAPALMKKEQVPRILLAGLVVLLSSDISFSYWEGHTYPVISYYITVSFLLSYFLFSLAAGYQKRRV